MRPLRPDDQGDNPLFEPQPDAVAPVPLPGDELDAVPSAREHPAAAFLGKEFLLWLWWRSERDFGTIELPHFGAVDLWIDDRIQFRTGGDDPQTSDLKGGAPATSAEARMALVSGKTVETARIGMRVKEREFFFSLRSDPVELAGLQVPGEVKDGVDERIYERMFLLEEATGIVDALFFLFCQERLDPDWNGTTLPAIRSWVAGQTDSAEA